VVHLTSKSHYTQMRLAGMLRCAMCGRFVAGQGPAYIGRRVIGCHATQETRVQMRLMMWRAIAGHVI